MENNPGREILHPEGEPNSPSNSSKKETLPTQLNRTVCDTFQGVVHLEWDPQAPVTPLGQLPFFIDFLKTSCLYDQWVRDCPLPLKLKGPHSSGVDNILGTLFLSSLSGQRRYAHITAIRNDEVNPPLLGMTKIVSEDTARRAFQFIDEENLPESDLFKQNYERWQNLCEEWQQKNLNNCYGALLCEPWILDMDTTVKPLYGHQEGAEVGYNPQKPGRPAHIIHTYMMAGTRLILDSEVFPGKQMAASYTLPRLLSLIDDLPEKNRPTLVLGDCAFGTERVLHDLESRKINYLFKIKKTQGVKALIDLVSYKAPEEWIDVGQGWSGIGGKLKLYGWTKERQVLIQRRPLRKRKPGRPKKEEQLLLPFTGLFKADLKYEYSVLVTNLQLSAPTIVQLYRDRADSENVFDELKNQWGWGGFVTQDLLRSQIMARIVAQVYNWWSLFTRLADPTKRREAITSRPLLLYGVGRRTMHAGQTKITITPTHAKFALAQEMMTRVKGVLNWFKSVAEQFTTSQRWIMMLSLIFKHFLKGNLLGSTAKMPPGFEEFEFG
ncbi:MAG: transposase [Parachlamydiaceae bacterium]|nr:transposase [Parachlamydiaceae bacterium]